MNTGRVDINSVLDQMRMMRQQAQISGSVRPSQDAVSGGLDLGGLNLKGVDKPNFQNALISAVDKVNGLQQQSASMAKSYELGDTSVSLSDAMVASQKANISFQAMTQVRNRLVEAYQEIMNMPV